MRMVRFFICVFSCFFVVKGYCQPQKYNTAIFRESIKTLKAFVDGNAQSYPAIELHGDAKVLIQFDDLTANARNYSYQVIHCNYDWTVSELFSYEFLDGFNENGISSFDFSQNTRVNYINYSVLLPNSDVGFIKSGNYIFRVIEDGDREQTILTQRFCVYEPLVRVDAEIVRPLGSQVQDNSQEIKLSINHDDLEIGDPFSEVKVIMCQNNRPDRVIKDIKPVFVKNGELVYGYSGDNIFLAGNEFRMFSFTNIQKFGINVNDIQYVDSMYHVQLRLDERRSFKRYFWDEDMNGKSIVYVDNTEDAYRSADYAYVYFALPVDEPFLEGSVYVFGGLTQWETTEKYKMRYNFDSHMYEAVLLLKQGYYNYIYTYYDNYTKKLDESVLEGSHYQTENDYVIYVYHRAFSGTYDRLVGYKVINSKYQD